jgi:hypothetical protein
MPQVMKEMGINPAMAMQKMRSGGIVSTIPGMNSRQLILNLISLCIFPFAAKPVVLDILYNGDNEAYIEAMEERKILIPQVLKQLLRQNMSE